jgi:hypothetical protein
MGMIRLPSKMILLPIQRLPPKIVFDHPRFPDLRDNLPVIGWETGFANRPPPRVRLSEKRRLGFR